MWAVRPLVWMCICALSLLGCSRKTDSKASIQLNFESFTKGISAQGSGFDLNFVAINVFDESKALIASKSFHSRRDMQDNMIPVPAALPETVEVPSGVNITVQVLAVVETETSSGEFWYKGVAANLAPGAQSLTVTLGKIGTANVGDANISGRYLTGPNVGPTEKVKVMFQPPVAGEQKMLVETLEMFSGWFRFFAIEGGALEYRLADSGTVLFGGPVGIDSASLVAAGNVRSLRVKIPEHYYVRGEAGGTRRRSDPAKNVYGFFGPGVTTEEICYNSGTSEIDYAYKFATGSALIQWAGDVKSDSTKAFVLLGGSGETVSPGTTCAPPGDLYQDFISLNEQMITSNDRVLGFRGPYQMIVDGFGGSKVMEADYDANDGLMVTWNYLPGVQSDGPVKGIDGSVLFAREEDSDMANFVKDFSDQDDGVKCDALEVAVGTFRPFTRLADVPATANIFANSGSINLSSVPAALEDAIDNGHYTLIACPYSLDASGKKVFYKAAAVNYPMGNLNGPIMGGFGPPEIIGISEPQLVMNSGSCKEIEIVLQNSSGGDSDPTLNPNIRVNVSSSGGVTFWTHCGSGNTTLSYVDIPNGSNSAFIGMTASSTQTVTFADDASNLAPYSGQLKVASSMAATSLKIMKANGAPLPEALLLPSCTGIKFVGVNDSHSDRLFSMNATIDLSADIDGDPVGAFYSDPTCSSSTVTTVGALSGASASGVVYYKTASPGGRLHLSGKVANYVDGATYDLQGMVGLPVGAATEPVYLSVSTSNDPLANDSCESITVIARDAAGSAATVSADTLVYFEGINANFFETMGDCTGPSNFAANEVTIPSGNHTATVYIRAQDSGSQFISAMSYDNGTYMYGSKSVSVAKKIPDILITEIHRTSTTNNNVDVTWDPVGNADDTNTIRLWVSTDGTNADDMGVPGSDLCSYGASVGSSLATITACPNLVDAGSKFLKVAALDDMGFLIPGSITVYPMLIYHNLSNSRVLPLGNGNSVNIDSASATGTLESPGPVDCSGLVTGDGNLTACVYTAPSTGIFGDEILIHHHYNGTTHLYETLKFTE